MTESIGSKIRNIAVGILIGLLVIGFAVWGVSDVFTPNVGDAAAKIGDEKISLQEFDDALRRELQNQARESGTGLTNQQAYDSGLHIKILSQLMTQKAMDVDAIDLGIGVNRKTAREFVSEIPSFQDPITGVFSEDTMDSVLQNNRITRADFERDILMTLRRQQTVPAMVSGLELPRDISENFYQYISEQRTAQVLTLNDRAVESPADPGDEPLQAYIKDNEARFTDPEYRKITFIRLEPFDLAPDLDVSEEEIKASFDYRVDRGELGTEETRSVVQITANDEASAKEAALQLENALDPTDIATGLGLIEPLTYDDVSKDDILDPITADTAFELELGKAKAVLGSLGNWYAVSTRAINPGSTPNLDDIRDEITRDLRNELALEKLFDVTSDIENAISDGLTLEEISKDYDVPYSEIDFFNRSGKLKYGEGILFGFDAIPGIGSDETILKEIFTAEIGRVTDLFETDTNGFMAVRVDDVIDPAVQPFEATRSQALAGWTTLQVDALIQEKMLELAGRAQTGETLETLKNELGAAATLETVTFSRGQQNDQIGARVIVGILDGEIGTIARGVGAKPLTRQIAKVTDIAPNQVPLSPQILTSISQQLENAISNDLQTAYRDAIYDAHPVTEYLPQIERLMGVSSGAEN